MPLKSKAQRRKFAQLLVEGKISPETFEEWNRSTGSKKLPERLHPKKTVKRARQKAGKKPARKRVTRSAKKKRTSAARKRR